MTQFYQVAVNFPLLDSLLTYKSEVAYKTGDLILVPLGKRKAEGCVIQVVPALEDESIQIKEIEKKISENIHLPQKEIELFEWISKYYQYSLGQVIFDSLPQLLKRPRAFLPLQGKDLPLNYDLNAGQKEIYTQIETYLEKGFSKHYIHGITGSGKTSIYLHLIKDSLKKGNSALFLIPEINLTPQFCTLLEEHLNCPIFLYHSAVTNSDRYNLYNHLLEDSSPKVILGVRSSVFLPIQKLGLIIVDEEHDSSFKQDDRCPYNGRDVAIKKAQIAQIPIILGSATPSLENYYIFKSGAKSHYYYSLEKRAALSSLPTITLVDERVSETRSMNPTWPIMKDSIKKIEESFLKNEQVIVFVNRLGFANYIQCRSCGQQFNCPNCSVTLKYFKKKSSLECSHCQFKIPFPHSCPKCNCLTLEQKGYGTEKVHEILSAIFPDKKIERFDRDEIKTLEQLELKLNRFHEGKIDLFVGTQMLSKGHNFKRVNLVLILGVDAQLNFPDFRSNEKIYQLLTQVSGRAGRFGDKSEVLIQTLNKDNPLFSHVMNHSFSQFYVDELDIRKSCFCPPYSKLAIVYIHSRFQDRVVDKAMEVFNLMSNLKNQHFTSVVISEPRPANIEKRANQFTWCLLLKATENKSLHDFIHNFYRLDKSTKKMSGVSVKIDIDPYNLL
ncbi:MAG: replication restart helicase PriA [Bacteriovoracaceae bacterium]